MRVWLTVILLSMLAHVAAAGPTVQIIVDKQAPGLERFAADELGTQLKRLFQADVTVTDKFGDAEHVIVMGSPTTNPLLKNLAATDWLVSGEQGHQVKVVKLAQRQVLVVGGGSPAATLWAAYELGYQLGMRYLTHADVDPANPGNLKLDHFNIVLHPKIAKRGLILLDPFVTGTEFWGLADLKVLLKQAAKMKFNTVILAPTSVSPFVDYEWRGVKKTTAEFAYGWKYPIDANSAGRTAFKGATEFTNPDFVGLTTAAQKHAAGKTLMLGVLETARELGMHVEVNWAMCEYPQEFRSMLGNVKEFGPNDLAVRPNESWPNATHAELVKVQVSALNRLQSGLVINPMTGFNFATSRLQDHYNALPTALANTMRPQGAVQWMPEAESKLDSAAMQSLIQTVMGSRSTQPRGPVTLRLIETQVVAFHPTPFRPDFKTLVQGKQLQEVSLSVALLAGGPTTLHYVSRLGFDEKLSIPEARAELVQTVADEAGIERMLKAWQLADEASALIPSLRLGNLKDDKTALNGLFPGCVMQAYHLEKAPAWWAEARTKYVAAMNEFYRANQRSPKADKPFTRYSAKKCESAMHLLNCLEAVQLAGVARREGKIDAAIEQIEKAIESMYFTCDTIREVARDRLDLGLIAGFNEYGYRPLKQELEALEKAQQ